MAVYLSSIFGAGAQLLNNQGVILANGTLNTFVAATTTPVATYIDNTQTTQNGSVITLDAFGRPPQEIWIPGGTMVKFVVKDSTGVQIGNAFDNIAGINDPANGSSSGGGGGTSLTVWTVAAATPTFLSATSFSVPGDLRTTFPIGTRVKSTITAGTAYSTVSAVAFGAFTTVTVVNDSTTLDSGLSVVATSVNTVTSPNVGAAAVAYNAALTYPAGTVGADLVSKATVAATTTTNLAASTKATSTAGGPTTFTLTPVPAIASYVTGQTWLAQANAASSGATTINISGQGVNNLKQLNGSTKVNATLVSGAIYELAYDGTDVVVMNPTAGTGKLVRITNFNATGTWTKGADVNSVMVEVQAAGGGGGSTTGSSTGGGGGGYAKVYVSTPGATEAVTVGAGGVGSNSPTTGGVSSFGAWASATGGVINTGAGGVGTVGDILLSGGSNGASQMGGGMSVLVTSGLANSGVGGGPSGSPASGNPGGSGRVIVYEFS